MLIDGEKWACEACVRGHRVSSCHHSDRPLTHINKKGRPVSQCVHCRGLRKSRTTHVKCECGDKKKNSHKHDSDSHTVDKKDLKQESRHRCGCTHGQRCTCALKKEHHLDPVPETGLPPSQPSAPSELKKPHLTSTKSESTLTIFRDGHHKPAHKHNDMAHKCGMPYTIPRSHTIHSTSDVARRSVDHLPSALTTNFVGGNLSQHPEQLNNVPQRRAKSEHGSPDSAPVTTFENATPPTSIPPLELSSFFDTFTTAPQPPLEQSHDGSMEPASIPTTFDKMPLEQIVTSVAPLDVSSFSFPTTTTSPITCMAFQDPYQENYFASPDTDFPLGSAGLSAPPVDWSSFPLYSDVPAAPSTQAPSYASFDYNSYNPGLPAPSSSGDTSEVDEFGPLPGLGHAGSEIHDLSEGSDVDHYRVSSASSFIGLPQAQLLSSNNLESINIDDFLKSANESTAALEHQLQANMGMETKPLPTRNAYSLSQAQTYEPVSAPITGLPMTTSPADPIWPAALFDSAPTAMDENYYRQSWAQ